MPFDTVYLENQTWNQVNVESHMGNNSNPEANPSLGTRILTRGSSWQIDSPGEDIYYHRDADPDHPNGQWQVWTRRACFGNGSVYHEML
jgi:hypothetical protein